MKRLTKLVGVNYEWTEDGYDELSEGDVVELVQAPWNKYDEEAIEVYTDNISFCGFVANKLSDEDIYINNMLNNKVIFNMLNRMNLTCKIMRKYDWGAIMEIEWNVNENIYKEWKKFVDERDDYYNVVDDANAITKIVSLSNKQTPFGNEMICLLSTDYDYDQVDKFLMSLSKDLHTVGLKIDEYKNWRK